MRKAVIRLSFAQHHLYDFQPDRFIPMYPRDSPNDFRKPNMVGRFTYHGQPKELGLVFSTSSTHRCTNEPITEVFNMVVVSVLVVALEQMFGHHNSLNINKHALVLEGNTS